MEVISAVVCNIARGLFLTDIVGPHWLASMAKTLGDKTAACEEVNEGWKHCVQKFI